MIVGGYTTQYKLGIIILHYVYCSHVSSEAGLSGEQPANMPEPMEDEEEQAQTPGRHNILGLKCRTQRSYQYSSWKSYEIIQQYSWKPLTATATSSFSVGLAFERLECVIACHCNHWSLGRWRWTIASGRWKSGKVAKQRRPTKTRQPHETMGTPRKKIPDSTWKEHIGIY